MYPIGMLIEALFACFVDAPQDALTTVQAIDDKERLKNLLRWAIHSDTVDAFRQHLLDGLDDSER